jgi:enamine deaminase RidA (YjgF/YER057c/UK114 family)
MNTEDVMIAEKQIIEVPGLFDSRPLGYEQCIAAGELVFVAGQGGDLDERMQLVSADFAPQVRQALANVRRALAAAGATPADVTAVTVYLTDMANLRAFGAIKAEALPDLRATSTAVEVSRLALPGMLVEVTVTAVRSRL